MVTPIIKVLCDVKHRRGRLPPVPCIQVDKLWKRIQEYIYILGLCATLVAFGFFKEIQLSFLIISHTHEDIDQCFSYISSTLKQLDIDSLEEMLQIIRERPTFTESFIYA